MSAVTLATEDALAVILDSLRGGSRIQQAVQHRARQALSAELGRRHGWPRYRQDRRGAQHLLGKRPRWHQQDPVPHSDHSGFYSDGRRITALVEQPYPCPSLNDDVRAWATERGLFACTPDFPSWWFPGWTRLILVTAYPLPGETPL